MITVRTYTIMYKKMRKFESGNLKQSSMFYEIYRIRTLIPTSFK